jgi:polyisoprenoid-binding protein YceI
MRATPLTVSLVATFAAGLALAATQWSVQPAESKVVFVGKQAGAAFEGEFKKFTSDIKFDPADLAGSHFDVKIDTASADSKDAERDQNIRGDDFFAVKKFASAHYVTDKFTSKGGNKFSATGKLTIRDVTRDVPIDFTFETGSDGKTWLKGTAALKRLDFGVGQGDWKSTEWVANEVAVKFTLALKK